MFATDYELLDSIQPICFLAHRVMGTATFDIPRAHVTGNHAESVDRDGLVSTETTIQLTFSSLSLPDDVVPVPGDELIWNGHRYQLTRADQRIAQCVWMCRATRIEGC